MSNKNTDNPIIKLAILFIDISPVFLGIQLLLLLASFLIIWFNIGENFGKSILNTVGILMGDSYEKFSTVGIKLWWITPVLLTMLRFSGWFITPLLVAILLNGATNAVTEKQDRTEIVTSKLHIDIRTKKNQEIRARAVQVIAENYRKMGYSEADIKQIEQNLQ